MNVIFFVFCYWVLEFLLLLKYSGFVFVACFQWKIKIRDCSKCWMMWPAFWFKIRFGHNNISHIKPKRQKIICFVARVWKPHLVYSKYIQQNTFQANRLKTKKKKKKKQCTKRQQVHSLLSFRRWKWNTGWLEPWMMSVFKYIEITNKYRIHMKQMWITYWKGCIYGTLSWIIRRLNIFIFTQIKQKQYNEWIGEENDNKSHVFVTKMSSSFDRVFFRC